MLIIFTLMAIFGWGWRIGGLPMGWVGVGGVVVYLAWWNLRAIAARRLAKQEALRWAVEEFERTEGIYPPKEDDK